MKQEIKYLVLVGIVILAGVGFLIFSGEKRLSVVTETQLKSFQSVDELKNFIESSQADSYPGATIKAGSFSGGAPNAAALDSTIESSAYDRGSDSYSTTNIQVSGVDEPDIVKNDGKYIYSANGKTVSIIEAYPADKMRIVKNIELGDYVNNIFLKNDKLIIFSNHYDYIEGGACPKPLQDFSVGIRAPCGGYSREETKIDIYDISDKENPVKEKEFAVSGNYVDARMTDGYVYLISSKYVSLNSFELPYYYDDAKVAIEPTSIYYLDYSDNNYVFNIVSAIDIENEEINTKTFMLGSSYSIYVSEHNMYLVMQKSLSQKEQFDRFTNEVVLEILPSEQAGKVREIVDSDLKTRIKSREVNEVVSDYADSLEGGELQNFLEEYSSKSQKFYQKISEDSDMSVIHKISFDKMDVEYEGSGEVRGTVLNQFSMDENEGKFRIATTSNEWNGNATNNLYVLDEGLNVVGKVEGLAPGERIYSARFVGERAYVVTFRQVDPLFVIDLSESENPKVLGYLKITGYSGYLHPYDETHLIGVGQEASEDGRVQGVKIALFDVSDVENVRIAGSYVADGQWSSTDVLYDHKAFLFDKNKNLMALPISTNNYVKGNYEYWQGVYVFNVSLDGIKLRGKISHDVENETEQYYYGRQDYVRRSLFIDNTLYTISNRLVKASSLSDLSETKKIVLPFDQGPIYYANAGVASAEDSGAVKKTY